jgi:hypothetical protein
MQVFREKSSDWLVDGTLGKKTMAITIENDYQDTPMNHFWVKEI